MLPSRSNPTTSKYGSCDNDDDDSSLSVTNHHHHHTTTTTTTEDDTRPGDTSVDERHPSPFWLGRRKPSLLLGIVVVTVFSLWMVMVIVSFQPVTTSLFLLGAMESSSSSSNSNNNNNNNNALIDLLQSSSTIIHPQSYYDEKVDEYPAVSIDLEHERQVYNGHTTKEETSMTISWTNGQFRSSSSSSSLPILSPPPLENHHDIVAVLCGDSDSHLQYYMDARTIADAVRGQQQRRRGLTETEWYYNNNNHFDWWGGSGTVREKTWHSSSSSSSSSSTSYDNNDDSTDHHNHHHESDGNVWYISSVPSFILDQRKCQAVLYYYIREDEYVIIGKSNIIHL